MITSYLQSAYQVRNNEPKFKDFLNSNRKILLYILCIFVVMCLCAIYFFDIYYFYGYLINDALNYHLRGWYLLQYGSTAARFADNLPPYHYVALPGYLRIPFLAISERFDVQLRLIQFGNIFLMGCIGIIFSYILYSILPITIRKASVFLAFSVIVLSSQWQVNLIMPLGDSFFVLFVCLAMVCIRSVNNFTSEKYIVTRLSIICLLICCATITKFTGVFLCFYALLCWYPLLESGSRRCGYWLIASGLAVSAVLIYINGTVIGRYLKAGLARIHKTSPFDWMLNLLGISLPAQIIPNFHYFYSPQLSQQFLNFNWFASMRDIVVFFVGISISALTLVGMWRSRKSLFPEIVFLGCCLPFIVPITTSTTRYLAPFQVFIIIFFYYGCQHCFPKMLTYRYPKIKLALALFVTIVVVLGAFRIYGSTRNYSSNYYTAIKGVATTYKQLDTFIGMLDPKTTRLLYTGCSPGEGKWQPIHALRYVAPDGELINIVKNYNVYVVLDQNLKFTRNFQEIEQNALDSLSKWGRFNRTLVFDSSNKYAWGRVYRITTAN